MIFIFNVTRCTLHHSRNNSNVFEELEVSVVDLTVANYELDTNRIINIGGEMSQINILSLFIRIIKCE